MDKIFLSQTNFSILLQIVNEKLVEKYPNCIRNKKIQVNFKRELMGIMKQIYKDRETFDIPCSSNDRNYIRYLNEHVLDFIIPQFKSVLKVSNHPQPEDQPNHIDPPGPHKTRVNQYSQTPKQNIPNRITDVNDKFEQINQARMLETNAMKPKAINFTIKEDVNAPNPLDLYARMEEARKRELVQISKNRKIKDEGGKAQLVGVQSIATQPNIQPKSLSSQHPGIPNQPNKQTQTLQKQMGNRVHKSHNEISNSVNSFSQQQSIHKQNDLAFERRLKEISKERNIQFKKSEKNPEQAIKLVIENPETICDPSKQKTRLDERIITQRMAIESQKTDDKLLLYRKNDEDVNDYKTRSMKRIQEPLIIKKVILNNGLFIDQLENFFSRLSYIHNVMVVRSFFR